MPRRRRKVSNNEKIQVKEEKAEVQVKAEASTEQKQAVEKKQEVKAEVETGVDPVVDHLKQIGALDVIPVCEDPINPPMSFYIAIVVPKNRKTGVPVPALVKANSRTGYVRSMVPIAPNVFDKIVNAFKDAVVKCEQLKTEAERRMKEIQLKQMLAKLSPEDRKLLMKMLQSGA